MNDVFEYAVHLRWSDADRNGHINNGKFATFAEDARIRWFESLLGGRGDMGSSLILARQEIDYLRQVIVEDEADLTMTMRCYALSVGRTSTRIREELWGAGDVDGPAAAIECVLVHFDYQSGSSQPWSDQQRAWIESYLRVDEPAAQGAR